MMIDRMIVNEEQATLNRLREQEAKQSIGKSRFTIIAFAESEMSRWMPDEFLERVGEITHIDNTKLFWAARTISLDG